MLPSTKEHWKQRRAARHEADRRAARLVTQTQAIELCRSCLEASMVFDFPPYHRVTHWNRELVREVRREL